MCLFPSTPAYESRQVKRLKSESNEDKTYFQKGSESARSCKKKIDSKINIKLLHAEIKKTEFADGLVIYPGTLSGEYINAPLLDAKVELVK